MLKINSPESYFVQVTPILFKDIGCNRMVEEKVYGQKMALDICLFSAIFPQQESHNEDGKDYEWNAAMVYRDTGCELKVKETYEEIIEQVKKLGRVTDE